MTTIYKFYKDNCQPCQSLTNILATLKIPENVLIIPVDVQTDNGLDLASSYSVTSVPTLVKHTGESLVGFQSIRSVKEFILG